jgi:hypothetical protein
MVIDLSYEKAAALFGYVKKCGEFLATPHDTVWEELYDQLQQIYPNKNDNRSFDEMAELVFQLKADLLCNESYDGLQNSRCSAFALLAIATLDQAANFLRLAGSEQRVDEHQERSEERSKEARMRILGSLCSMCGLPQVDTPSGVTCPQGHGGAPPKEESQ